ncbi:proline iminopeptidase-family hydrolase [Sphingomonas prati]|uniref:Proline iminopeptidase/L-proline amide hydrolase n=1 Tax=Sphingomonas prati TaxID=1843237 RepID=A0A7W9BS78_9SPHN|nr:proline iminopeptidase-family hydrolase [Sphingomonas prati]MBB5729171.1 proline iminopeptidase/L-proline amide hydrolase [Sphingomonas prati]GGE84538.1 amino acid amidase [Sphingomonas prati]
MTPLGSTAVAAPATRTQRVAVEGGTLHVRIDGDLTSGRTPLLLVHGGPGGSHAGLIPAAPLATDRAVIFYDQLDCGRSDHPGDPANWTVDRFASEIAAIRTALGLDRVHLFGHSWGATLALEHAARTTGIASLVLMGPLVSTAAWLADAATLRTRLPADVQATLIACEGPNPPAAEACRAATRAYYDRYWCSRDPDPVVTAYASAMPRCFTPAMYEAMWGTSEFSATGTLADYDGTPLLAQLQAPTLFLIGDSDEVTEPTALKFAAMVPHNRGTTIVVAGAAHRLQNDRPDLFLMHLRDWMRLHDGLNDGDIA